MAFPRNNTRSYFLLCYALISLFSYLTAGFQVGVSYQYQYETSVLFNEVHHKTPNEDKLILAKVVVTPLYQLGERKFVKLQVLKPDKDAAGSHSKYIKRLQKFPIFFEIHENGEVTNLYMAATDSIFSTNFKKGIINLFQLKTSEETSTELDISGNCSVKYTNMGGRIIKIKENCTNMEIAGDFSGAEKLLGVSTSSTSAISYILNDGIIDTAVGNGASQLKINLNTSMGAKIDVFQKLKLTGQVETKEKMIIPDLDEAESFLDTKMGYDHIISLLPSSREIQHCTQGCISPLDLLSKVKEVLRKEQLSTLASASAFLEYVRSFRNQGKEIILQTLTHADSYYIVPQLIDIASAAQSKGSHKAIMELLNFEGDHTDYPERYLFTLAYATKPAKFILNNFLKIYKKKIANKNLKESVGLTLGALMFTYCLVPSQCEENIVKEYIMSTKSLISKCKTEECQLIYLRSMGNAGLKEFLPILLEKSLQTKPSSISSTAVYSLRRFKKDVIAAEAVPVMLKIYKDKTRESSARLAALEVMLSTDICPLALEEVLRSLKKGDNSEFATYTISKLNDMAQNDPTFKKLLKSVIEKLDLLNYVVFTQNGTSSAFSSYLTVSKSVNSTYGLFIENSKSSLMKRSSLDVELFGKEFSEKLLSFRLYADGIESLVSDESTSEEVEPTAGMSLTLFDVLLRPVEFFRGSGELMSAAWNAPSEPTSALQGNILLQDEHQTLHLMNGFIAKVDLMTALSLDISGSMVNSIWSRTSQSVVTNSGALLFDGSVKLESKILKAGIDFKIGGEGHIDFKTDVDFLKMPVKSCMRMMRPHVSWTQNITKYDSFSSKRHKTKINRTYQLPDMSYFLNQFNSKQCHNMIDSLEL
ncbi:triglyceride transfer large subunit-like [Octopus vulgaris]|uniref:Triglyceride transfer large subunit-like n=1 Tax=Octopus vulgaris TaxID=6645 RepID=A0AA36F485_OCTVU|nr:triglyceride transfer large subunit-like [Octopus vulgaris]